MHRDANQGIFLVTKIASSALRTVSIHTHWQQHSLKLCMMDRQIASNNIMERTRQVSLSRASVFFLHSVLSEEEVQRVLLSDGTDFQTRIAREAAPHAA